jgi:hypothetical protein
VTIAADPKHLGACVGITSVLHSWGSAMTHHPHVHMIVPGGGISLVGERWVASIGCGARGSPVAPGARIIPVNGRQARPTGAAATKFSG